MGLSHRSLLIALFVAATLLIMQPKSAEAHKLNIFAWPVGKAIYGETVFKGKRKAKNIKITVQDVERHNVLVEMRSDDQGEFNFNIPEEAEKEELDLLIVADSEDGHRGEWILTAAEYLVRSAPSDFLSGSVVAQAKTRIIEEQTVRRIILEELHRELAPIKQTLAEGREEKISLRDIAGGIGCIIGLAGLLVWLKTKKQKNKAEDGGVC